MYCAWKKKRNYNSEGGLNLGHNKYFLKKLIKNLKKNKSRISLFAEPNLKDLVEAKKLDADCVEIIRVNL